MSKFLSVLISLSLTACLFAGYFLNANYAADFSAYVILSLSTMALFCAPFIGHYLQKFDDDEIKNEDVTKVIKPMATTGVAMTVFNSVNSIAQLVLLIATGSMVIATIYLISSVSTIALRVACKKRYKEWIEPV